MKNKIKVIVPFYNASSFLERCVLSITKQEYENFDVIFINDCSTDNSWDLLPHDVKNCICINNPIRKTALENIHNAVINYCNPEDIVAIVDGDDFLLNKKVLSYINDFYNKNDCWIMYGNSTASDGSKIASKGYAQEEFKMIRNGYFFVSHIRTFRAGLYHKIKDQDEEFSCLKDKNGEFYKMTYDVAMLLPMMEMAGYEKIKFNEKILYVYNRENPISDCYVNENLQKSIHFEINNKKRFNKIDKLWQK